MSGHFGFSYIGFSFLLLLFIPNIIWTKNMPQGYTSENENRILLFLERAGEVLVCCCALIFSDFNVRSWSAWSWWLAAAVALMVMYELWWIRYFRSERRQEDFYSSFAGVPLAGATLPVAAFFLLGIYGKVIWMMIAAAILAVGHIGIHLQHSKNCGGAMLSEKSIKFDRENQRAVLRCSICNGEQVAGFKDVHTGKFQEVMVIRSDRDMESFRKQYGLDDVPKEY